MISRRALLWGLIGGGALTACWLALGRLGTRRLGLDDPADLLRANFAGLSIAPAAFDAYLEDWAAQRGRLSWSSRIGDEFFTQFLMSSDLFYVPGAGSEARPVRYLRWYDRWESACVNPFAQFDDA